MIYNELLAISRRRFNCEYEMYKWLHLNGLYETALCLFPHYEMYYVDDHSNPYFRSRDWELL